MQTGRRGRLITLLLLAGGCAADEPGASRTPTQAAGMLAPPPAADAGSNPEDRFPDLPDARVNVVELPDDDGGTLPLPTSAAMKPPADPSIMFDWEETEPGGTCEPGRYSGTFSCVFILNDAFAQMFGGMAELTGPVTLTLERSMNGEFLEISDGQFEAVAQSFIGARATISGKLDCRTKTFQATLSNGSWAIGDPAMPFWPGGMLTGSITGSYQNDALSGLWSIGDPMLGNCDGAWTAELSP